MGDYYWKTIETTERGGERYILQQKHQLLGGDTLIPTAHHRVMLPNGYQHDEFSIA